MEFKINNLKPDKERFITALKSGIPDKVSLFDNYIDDKIVENILGYNAGNTIAAIGDPYRGDERSIVEGDVCIPMDPNRVLKKAQTKGVVQIKIIRPKYENTKKV